MMSCMKLDLLTLKLFVRVLEEGTISKAAELEHIASAAVSRRLADLEHHLDTPLLYRTNKGISPTPAGVELLYRARALLNNAYDLETRLHAYAKGQHGQVHIMANTSAVTQFLPAVLGQFAQQFPQVQLQLEEKSSLDIINALSEGKTELGIFTRLPFQASIETFTFRHDELVVLVPQSHPLAKYTEIDFIQTLDYAHISLFAGTHIHYQISKIAMEHNRALSIQTEVSGYDAMCLLINAGIGIGILPRESTQIYHIPNTRTIALRDAWRSRELLVGVRKQSELSPSAASLLALLLAEAPK